MADGRSSNAKKTASKGVSESGDKAIGRRLRLRRTELKITQQMLGEHVSVSFQQIQKYENGTNRISGGKLGQFAQYLKVTPGYFYGETNGQGIGGGFSSGQQATLEDLPRSEPIDPKVFDRQETYDLIVAYYTIVDARQRRKVLDTVRAMASLAEDS